MAKCLFDLLLVFFSLFGWFGCSVLGFLSVLLCGSFLFVCFWTFFFLFF